MWKLPVKLLLFPFTLARFIIRSSWLFIILAIVVTIFLVPGIDLLETKGGFDTLVSTDSNVFKNTRQLETEFGGDPIVVVLKGPLDDIFSPESLTIIDSFETIFSSQNDVRVHSVLSPVTILKAAAEEAGKMGYVSEWNDPELINAIIGNSSNTMRPEMAKLVPDNEHALMTITADGSNDYETSLELLGDIQFFFSSDQNPIPNVGTAITGDLEMMDEISNAIGNDMAKLLIMSVAIMEFILLVSFRVRWNLLALLMVGIAALWTFGIMGYLGVPLSMATMAGLPVLIGLGIDYSIQFHKRYQEEAAKTGSVDEALTTSTARMWPSVGIALVSTLIGFITLYISEVPMIRDFGLMLALGMLISYGVAFFTLNSIINVHERRLRTISLGKAAQAATRYMELSLSFLAKIALRLPLLIVILAVTAAVAGAVVDRWLPTNSDFESLMPQGADVLDDIEELREVQGYMGQLRFMITADDVTVPDVLEWMRDYQNKMVAKYGLIEEAEDFGKRIIAGSDSLVTLISAQSNGELPDPDEIDPILANTPEVIVRQFISDDRHMGQISFYIIYDSIEDVNDVIEVMIRDARDMEIPGVDIASGGSTAMGAKALNAMMGNRLLMNVLCLSVTFVVLVMIYRRLTKAIFIMIPVALVIGWASLGLYLARVALNPMTAVLGVLVVGIGTEFMVLILGRYQEERKNLGKEPQEAMVTAISTTGQAIIATALTTLGGFGILISSNFVLIKDFGIATTIAVFLCLMSSMIVMPPLIVWWDRHVAARLPRWL